MLKLAATKYVKLFREGKLSGEALAKIVNLHGKEKFIKNLGSGAEAVADLVTSPRIPGGLGVRKAYNPSGLLFSNRFFLKKDKVWRSLGGKSRFAGYYGKHSTAPITYHQYIPGVSSSDFGIFNKAGIKAVIGALLRGRRVSDIVNNPGNMISGKVVDFLPKGVDIKELPLIKARKAFFKRVLKTILKRKQTLSTNDPNVDRFMGAMLGVGDELPKNTIRAQAFGHQVKKEKLTPVMILRRAKTPLLLSGIGGGTTLLVNKEKQN